MQEAAESVASLELLDSGERGWWRRWLSGDGWAAAERSVRALGVVVIDVDVQDAVELARADDQQPVQALGPCGADEALGVCVGLWRPKRDWITAMPSVRKTSQIRRSTSSRGRGSGT